MEGLQAQKKAEIGRMIVICMISLVVSIGCADFSFYSLLDGDAGGGATGGPLEISPVKTTVVVGRETTFEASGGTPPYFFAVDGAGTIDSTTGLYTAPSSPTTDRVRVIDDAGNEIETQVTVIE